MRIHEVVKLDACGAATEIYKGLGKGSLLGIFNIPYAEFRKFEGRYLERVGYVVQIDKSLLNDFLIGITERWGCEMCA